MTAASPKLIAALQLPAFGPGDRRSAAWYEDYLVANIRVFVEGGIQAIKIQDETRQRGAASAETVARMSALLRLARSTFPAATFGVIVQAHDAVAPLAIAAATGARFVRLKVFVGAVVNAEGVRDGLGVEAIRYRAELGRPDIEILADVHDRTSRPLAPVPDEAAALWAENLGADRLVITGPTFTDTLARVRKARATGVRCPLLIGGGVDAGNVAQALSVADAAVVSTALLKRDAAIGDLVRWDRDAVACLVAAAQRA